MYLTRCIQSQAGSFPSQHLRVSSVYFYQPLLWGAVLGTGAGWEPLAAADIGHGLDPTSVSARGFVTGMRHCSLCRVLPGEMLKKQIGREVQTCLLERNHLLLCILYVDGGKDGIFCFEDPKAGILGRSRVVSVLRHQQSLHPEVQPGKLMLPAMLASAASQKS